MATRTRRRIKKVKKTVAKLTTSVLSVTAASNNETQLRHEIENALEVACASLSIPWTPFQLDRSLKSKGKTTKFVDVAHGAVVIEYEPPSCFRGRIGRTLLHARSQAEEYAELLSHEEGRSLNEYVLVAWDGEHINFGRFSAGSPNWESLVQFDTQSAERLLTEIKQNGVPLVHPKLLSAFVGPDSQYGISLIPLFFEAVCSAEQSKVTTKTKLLFTEWRRMFGQVVGIQPDSMKALLERQEISHGRSYQSNPAAYLFALNSYIALLAKVVAACALPNASQDIRDGSVPIEDRIASLESGELFEHAGILNMLTGDFFSWYADDPTWNRFSPHISGLAARLAGIDFNVSRKTAQSTRDLFKGIYESFVPRALRHALGEFYTPDWLAEHGLDTIGWHVKDDLLDPTCGSGTFLLDAVRRRRISGVYNNAAELLRGISGIDLNPLAILTAKGSLAVFVAPYLDPASPIRLPVYLADAINPASKGSSGDFEHTLQTEVGQKKFKVPEKLIQHRDFYRIFARIRMLIDADKNAEAIDAAVQSEFALTHFTVTEFQSLLETIETLAELHRQGWNGIWCSIIADRFAAGAIKPVAFICGNPPWVKWSHLPPEYAEFIKPRCLSLGVFSTDRWVGGIESDISTVITYEAIDKYLAPAGVLGFFITGTVFTNESSEGFRQFSLHKGTLTCKVELVEDYDPIKPFDGVSNHSTFLMVRRDAVTTFPVTYRVWSAVDRNGKKVRSFDDAAAFRATATHVDYLAEPVPGGKGARPWLVRRLSMVCSRRFLPVHSKTT